MKRILSLALALVLALGAQTALAGQVKTYEVPVNVMHYSRVEGKKSMADEAINKTAIVEVGEGETSYKVAFTPIEFSGLKGGITNLFVYNESNQKQEIAKQVEGETSRFEIKRTKPREDEITIAVWVDAMDAIAGGGPGSGEQDAILSFNWDEAKEIGGLEGTPKPAPSQDIKILVNGKAITMDVAPFIENDRTMVPVRFISEALGLKVNWVQESKTVEVGEKENKISLAIGQNKITKADGSQVAIDTPARIKEDRTFIPLRAIAEISGAKVGWDGATRTVTVDQ